MGLNGKKICGRIFKSMKLRNKNTGEIVELKLIQVNDKYLEDHEVNFLNGEQLTLKMLSDSFNDVKEPLVKDEKIRKAVRAWAEANGFSAFRVNNQHFNYVKIHGIKDRYDPNGSNIEFMGTIAGAEKRMYEIDELCGEGEE